MIIALIPAKTLGEAKTRLAATLSEQERRLLALAMLEDVVRALKSVPAIGRVVVVSPEDEVRELASSLSATPMAESANIRGINQALNRALSVITPPPDALIVVPADVPQITRAEVEEALAALPERGVVISPSHDKGTSLLAMRPAGLIPFRFGPNSFSMHKREAAARKAPAEVLRFESLARDIDEPDDLYELLAHPADTATHRLLKRLDIGSRAR